MFLPKFRELDYLICEECPFRNKILNECQNGHSVENYVKTDTFPDWCLIRNDPIMNRMVRPVLFALYKQDEKEIKRQERQVFWQKIKKFFKL